MLRVRHFAIAGLAVAGFLVASPALADELSFEPAGAPSAYAIPDVQPDVRGIAPGMTEAEVRAALAKAYPGVLPDATRANITYVRDGVVFRSRPVLAQVSVLAQTQAGQDELTVNFGLPTTGSPALGIQRRMDFANGPAAPRVAALAAQVIEKYGPPSFERSDARYGGRTLIWLFGGGKAQACGGTKPACPYISASFAIGRLDAYRKAVEDKSELMIQVDLIGHMQDPARVKTFKTTLADNRGAVATYEAAQEQILAVVDGRMAESRTGAGVPKL
ncbi:hypothetical protein [Azorhizobium doebereinerae]|uniref:hypothetical protein n=1 Tax=Azorhizobium doebereinerae TaxID=281091 RepID=UPI0003F9AD01|nr:hypothetical protein [Azorhizobium doebereinerae]